MVRPDPPVTADDLNAIFAGTAPRPTAAELLDTADVIITALEDGTDPAEALAGREVHVSTPKPNVALLRQTLAHIEAHPEEWNQRTYRCHTGMCFAGWAAELDGGHWAAKPDYVDVHVSGEDLLPRADDPVNHILNGLVDVRDRAERILGLDREQAFDLFDASNSLPVLRRIVDELCGGAE